MIPEGEGKRAKKRVRILSYDGQDISVPYIIELLYQLREAGFAVDFCRQTLQGLGMDAGRVARYVTKTGGDAWIVSTAPAPPSAAPRTFPRKSSPPKPASARGSR